MISKKLKYVLVFMIGALFLAPTLIQAKGDKKDSKTRLQKTTTQRTSTFLDINNISTWFYNNGVSDITPNGNSGLVFPKGSGKAAVFTAGLLWGAKVAGDPDPRVGGTAYRTGLVTGNVDASGNPPADNTIDRFRIYRVRPDIFPGHNIFDLSAEALNEATTEATLRVDYELDWTEWPVDMGAPYDDKDNSGSYDPNVDVPGVPGADQTIWFVANDLNAGQTVFLYGANPLGLEVSETIWAYNRSGALGNMFFRKYTFKNITDRNGTNVTFEDMYVTMWADIDLGEAGDDFIGTDTVLSLQYSYNANAVDAVYTPLPPPAVGFDFFQGPLVNGVAGQDINKNGVDDAADFGIFNGVRVGPGKINLPMTAAFYFANGDPTIGDPPQGTVDGSRQFYNFFQGRFGISGAVFTDLATGQPTTYALNGDPQAGTGWLDGLQLPAGDRRNGLSSGPFTMLPGDIQEVVIAEMVGGAVPGTDRLSAIGILKFFDQAAQQAYDNFFNLPNAPPAPSLNAVALDEKIVLDWGSNSAAVAATESNSAKGFVFQGYNVYQLPTASAQVEQAIRLAVYDKIDGVGKIEDKFFDASTGVVAIKVIQFGNDFGVQRSFTVTKDAVKGGVPLINGIKYYFAVTAYNFNSSPTAVPNNLENPIAIVTVIPQSLDPGVSQTAAAAVTVTKSSGTGDASPSIKVVDPTKVTGHNYEFFYNNQDYINDANGNWSKVTSSTKRDGNQLYPTDVSPSTMTMSAVFGEVGGTLELVAELTLVSPDFDFADGVRFDFPAGVTINSADGIHCAVRGDDISPTIVGTTILWGDSSRSTFGCFSGGEILILNISGTLPFDVAWTVYDDAYGDLYAGTTLGIIDAHGTFNLTTAGVKRVTQNQWGLKDVTLGTNVLENQTVFGGIDWYFGTGPGGSSDPILGGNLGSTYSVTVDGLEVTMSDLTFSAPITFLSLQQTAFGGATSLDFWGDGQLFGFPTGQSFYVSDFSGVVPSDYIEDIEFRFTGEAPDNDSPVTSGGQIAVGYDRALAFIAPIRVPFELWQPERNRQINFFFVSRNADGGAPWGNAGTVTHYRMSGRDYINPSMTDYDENVTSATVGINSNNVTWVLFFRQSGDSEWSTGDVYLIKYANNIIPTDMAGGDTYTFSTTAKAFNSATATTDVEKINVFPNPYYAVNTEELNKYQKFVTFNHLPVNAKIRIFNLAGVQVRIIDKVGGSQFQRWDLSNESGLPVASGIYIAFIDMPDLGTTKILKIAVIQEEQILDRF
ncbi:MAG: hypothetical protein IH949_00080 [Bacteroidetes bacterium]|nr:hypothetical protein [Bacteroidota bacterium]